MEREEIDYESPAAAARVLGSFGPEAKAAVPVLIDVLRTPDKDDDRWTLRCEVAHALGRIGPAAKEAVPVLRKVVDEGRPAPAMSGGLGSIPAQVSDAAVIALFHLAPDGQDLAEKWAERSKSPERKAVVLGAMGRKSLEGELLARLWLEDLNRVLEQGEPDGYETRYDEGYIERLGRLGVGAEAAIPRLKELRKHRSPWIRQWAGEVLMRIMPGYEPKSSRPS